MSKRGFTHEAPQKGATDEWYTPALLFEQMGLTFDVDPCAPEEGVEGYAVPAQRKITVREDGLVTDWGNGRAFVNWPYSQSPLWVARCFQHQANGNTAVTLSFNRSETEWAQALIESAQGVLFLQGRLQFVAGNNEIVLRKVTIKDVQDIYGLFAAATIEIRKWWTNPDDEDYPADLVDAGFTVWRRDHKKAMKIVRTVLIGRIAEDTIEAQTSGSAGAGNMLCALGLEEAEALKRMDAAGHGVYVEHHRRTG